MPHPSSSPTGAAAKANHLRWMIANRQRRTTMALAALLSLPRSPAQPRQWSGETTRKPRPLRSSG